jgi:hypothetical protein
MYKLKINADVSSLIIPGQDSYMLQGDILFTNNEDAKEIIMSNSVLHLG